MVCSIVGGGGGAYTISITQSTSLLLIHSFSTVKTNLALVLVTSDGTIFRGGFPTFALTCQNISCVSAYWRTFPRSQSNQCIKSPLITRRIDSPARVSSSYSINKHEHVLFFAVYFDQSTTDKTTLRDFPEGCSSF